MQTSTSMQKKIKEFEGVRLTRYKAVPTEKYYTIGYGHYGADCPEKITMEEANKLFEADIFKVEKAVMQILIKYNYTFMLNNQYTFDALVSFTYNCGSGNLERLLNYGKRNEKQVHDKIIEYNKSGGQILKGLQARRKFEQTWFAMGLLNIEENDTKKETSGELYREDYYVKANYTLRKAPNYGPSIRVLKGPEKCTLLGMPEENWLHIRTAEGQEAYVHTTAISVEFVRLEV